MTQKQVLGKLLISVLSRWRIARLAKEPEAMGGERDQLHGHPFMMVSRKARSRAQGGRMQGRWTQVLLVALAGCLFALGGCFPVNVAPVAIFSWTTNQLSVVFDASPSYDEDGSIRTYYWSFGDGTSANGELVTHEYSTTVSRSYQVTLRVTDDDGEAHSVVNTIQVTPPSNPAPTPPPTPPTNPDPEPDPSGSGITVRITASDAEIDIVSYEIETQGLWTLVGRARNVSGQTYDSVSIRARMLDASGTVIGTALDLQSDVTPGMTYEFSLWLLEEDRIRTIEIYEINALSWSW